MQELIEIVVLLFIFLIGSIVGEIIINIIMSLYLKKTKFIGNIASIVNSYDGDILNLCHFS